MGELLSGLGLGKQPSPVPTAAGLMGPTATAPGEVGGMPVPPTGTPPDAGGVGADIVMEAFKPKKANFFQRFADAYLMLNGGRPVFEPKIRNQNMQAAMEGFTEDPAAAIARLRKVDPEKAWELLDKYKDNERADKTADSLADGRQEKFLTRMGGMLYAIKDLPPDKREAAYQKQLPMLRRYAQDRNIPFELPDTFNEEDINSWVMGSVSPEEQLKLESLSAYRKARLGQMQQTIDQRGDYQQERLEDFDKAEEGRNARDANNPKKAQAPWAGRAGRVIKDGTGRLVEFNKDGSAMKVIRKDGTVSYFKPGVDGRPVLVKTLTAEELKKAAENK